MMRKKLMFLLFSNFVFGGLVLFGLMNSAISQQAGKQLETESLGKVKSNEILVRKEGAAELIKAREKLVKTLLAIASIKEENPVFSGPKELAINTLGEFRAMEGVPFLIKNVTYRVPYISSERNPIGSYPCGGSLIQIGAPSFPEIWERFRSPIEDLEVKLFAYIVRQIDGEEIGQARIELARKWAANIGTVDGLVARKNLDRLLEHYKTKKTGFR